jgi:hypothetical protein
MRGFVPDFVGYRIRAVAEACDGLGEGQGGTLSICEARRVSPGRYSEEAFVGVLGLLKRKARSTQTLQPLIWLARRWARPSVLKGTPPCSGVLHRLRNYHCAFFILDCIFVYSLSR